MSLFFIRCLSDSYIVWHMLIKINKHFYIFYYLTYFVNSCPKIYDKLTFGVRKAVVRDQKLRGWKKVDKRWSSTLFIRYKKCNCHTGERMKVKTAHFWYIHWEAKGPIVTYGFYKLRPNNYYYDAFMCTNWNLF